MGGVEFGLGQPFREIFEHAQKLLSAPLNFEDNIALAFLKAT
jgi:hypothetical protein